MIFWALRFAVGLSGLFALPFNWRLAVVLWFSLGVDVFTFLWMALPLFSLRNEMILLLLVGSSVGAVVSTGRKPPPVWLLPAGASLVLLILRGSYYGLGVARGTITVDAFKATSPGAVALIVTAGGGLLLGGLMLGAVRKRPRNDTFH